MISFTPNKLYYFFYWISIISYVPVVLFAFFFPNFISTVLFIDAFEGSRLDNFSSLMLLVAVLGMIYVLAKIGDKETLFDLSIYWRITLVAPILMINLFYESMEPNLIMILIATDFIVPLTALLISDKKQLKRLKNHFQEIPKKIGNRFLMVESVIGFILVFSIVISLFLNNNLGYGNTLVVSVFGCQFIALLWASYLKEKNLIFCVIGIKIAVLSVFYFTPILQIKSTHLILYYLTAGTIMYSILEIYTVYFPSRQLK